MLKMLGRKSLKVEDQEILQLTDGFVNSRNKTPEMKNSMTVRKNILRKINRTIARLRTKIFPEAVNLSKTSFADEVYIY